MYNSLVLNRFQRHSFLFSLSQLQLIVIFGRHYVYVATSALLQASLRSKRLREQAQIESCLKILVTVYYIYVYIYILMLFSMSTVTRPNATAASHPAPN